MKTSLTTPGGQLTETKLMEVETQAELTSPSDIDGSGDLGRASGTSFSVIED